MIHSFFLLSDEYQKYTYTSPVYKVIKIRKKKCHCEETITQYNGETSWKNVVLFKHSYYPQIQENVHKCVSMYTTILMLRCGL